MNLKWVFEHDLPVVKTACKNPCLFIYALSSPAGLHYSSNNDERKFVSLLVVWRFQGSVPEAATRGVL